MGIPILALRLEGPLQSWGSRSRWDYRDSALEPTKSGIIGLLGCALGWSRNDKRLESLDAALRLTVRIDKPGTPLIDFHTVQGYLLMAEGKQKKSGNDMYTVVSRRVYLQEASFLALLTGEQGALHQCKKALNDPVWPVFLGRKSCPPARPLFDSFYEGDFRDVLEAMRSIPWSSAPAAGPIRLRYVMEDEGGREWRQDVLRINGARMYGRRRVSVGWVDLDRRRDPDVSK
ncbi:crispr-associated protein cas5 [Heliomicrobium modesticaldum Ice1]|uniref:Crispr-associated protein cas5 n=1 Tax=Heliobacterium modesticaldum (strain ATCC 51547 / Ice1) TaxID=498761 RepID=B0TDU1_HELMI|nr:type I-E CRISPR-associated protein Cas5/CasD [Heliomicrobium modesticaldum]ABZ82804.1 crispr-associated protein cas5 [Heliomicrobium modesticaldum Ice1]